MLGAKNPVSQKLLDRYVMLASPASTMRSLPFDEQGFAEFRQVALEDMQRSLSSP
jgi:hypothetical protein